MLIMYELMAMSIGGFIEIYLEHSSKQQGIHECPN